MVSLSGGVPGTSPEDSNPAQSRPLKISAAAVWSTVPLGSLWAGTLCWRAPQALTRTLANFSWAGGFFSLVLSLNPLAFFPSLCTVLLIWEPLGHQFCRLRRFCLTRGQCLCWPLLSSSAEAAPHLLLPGGGRHFCPYSQTAQFPLCYFLPPSMLFFPPHAVIKQN